MDAQNAGCLRLIVAGCGQHFVDVAQLELAQAHQLCSIASAGRGGCGGRVSGVMELVISDLLRQAALVDFALRGQNHGALDHVLELANVARPRDTG